jgi:hypothetical protein
MAIADVATTFEETEPYANQQVETSVTTKKQAQASTGIE